MLYRSTRGQGGAVTGSQAVIRGIAEDGGLFVPEALPKLDRSMESFVGMSYTDTAYTVMKEFFPEFSEEELRGAVYRAYDGKFDTPEIVPVTEAGGLTFLELFHGPTLAFKDMALSFLPELMRLSLDKQGVTDEIVIITATSGDTGKAALEGFRNKKGIQVVVFYPKDGVSRMQWLQMVTEPGKNALVCAVEGNFDDAQSGVKEIFTDGDFAARLGEKGMRFSSANSINIGRLVPQVVYYVYGYAQLVKSGKLKAGEAMNVTVPTGNFGNILAAWYARAMGVPIGKFICASNKNNVLYDFFRTGIYDRNRPLYVTTSPSMDILISSNLERLLFEISGRDAGTVSELMESLKTEGRYEVTSAMKEAMGDFFGAYAEEDQVMETIRDIYAGSGYVLDTHTAVAAFGYGEYRMATEDTAPTLIASTASPFKFAGDVCGALGFDTGDRDVFGISRLLAEKAGLAVPENLASLETAEPRFMDACAKEDLPRVVADFLGL